MRTSGLSRRSRRTLSIIAGLIALAWLGIGVAQRQFYANRMPAKLELGWRYWHAAEGLLGDCGVAAFSLSDKTIASIRREGLAFFSDAQVARNVKDLYYKPWQRTPLSGDPAADAYTPIGLHCANGLDSNLRRSAVDGIRKPGSYYSGSGKRMLILLPDDGVVLLAYLG